VVVSRGLQAGEQVVADNALLLARQFHVAQEDSIGRGATPEAGAQAAAKPTEGQGTPR
jgi:cobalt-zinc-cadmium efflux system membrane fusion protein